MTTLHPPFDAIAPSEPEIEAPSPRQLMLRRARRHPGLIVSLIIVTIIALIAILAPYITSHDPVASNMGSRLTAPVWGPKGTWSYWLGTDYLGRDLWSRVAYGARASLLIGLGAATLSAVIGASVGMVGGYFGGRADAVVLYLINCRLALPGLLITLSLVSLIGHSVWVLMGVLGCLFWDRYAVIVRTATQKIATSDYITAARAVGASHVRILLTQVLPNVANHIIVVASLEIVVVILAEATLSYFGMGVPPPQPTWGSLIADGREYMLSKPFLIVVPGLALFILVVAINMLGDAIRDITSPEGRN